MTWIKMFNGILKKDSIISLHVDTMDIDPDDPDIPEKFKNKDKVVIVKAWTNDGGKWLINFFESMEEARNFIVNFMETE